MTITYSSKELYESNQHLVEAAVRATLTQFVGVERVNEFINKAEVFQGLRNISSMMSEQQWFNLVNGSTDTADCVAEIDLTEGDEFAAHIAPTMEVEYGVKISMKNGSTAIVTGKLGNVRRFLIVEYSNEVDAPLYVDRIVVNNG